MTWIDALVVVAGLGVGFVSGTIGVGGGILFVPFMTVGLRIHQTLAQGTSLAAIIPTATVGGVTHVISGNVVKEAAFWMGAGGALGAVLGAFVALYVPGGILARLFAVFLLFSSFQLFQRALRPSAPASVDAAPTSGSDTPAH